MNFLFVNIEKKGTLCKFKSLDFIVSSKYKSDIFVLPVAFQSLKPASTQVHLTSRLLAIGAQNEYCPIKTFMYNTNVLYRCFEQYTCLLSWHTHVCNIQKEDVLKVHYPDLYFLLDF